MSFLSDAELERLTGAARHKDQVAELERRGIPYEVNRRRQINVLWSAVEAFLGPKHDRPGPTSEPELSVFN